MQSSLGIRAIVWDFGGVLMRTNDHSGRARWERRLGLNPHELEDIVFQGEVGTLAALGRAQAHEVWQAVAYHLKIPPAELKDLERDFWRGDRLDQDLITYIRGLRPRLKTGLLSNAWSNLRGFLERKWNIADAFDNIVISAEVGLAKPDPRIYHLSLEGLGVASQETVFVDDFEENVSTARELGMHAVRFHTPDQTLLEINALLDSQA